MKDKGCDRADRKNMICPVYISPKYWWENMSGCPMATHWKAHEEKQTVKQRVGQQKQKKKR
jgi:hypothetical protein